MKPSCTIIVSFILLAGILTGCGGSDADQSIQETEVARAIEATLAAQAPPPTQEVVTVVVTPPSPTQAPTLPPTEPPPTEPPPTPLPTQPPPPSPTTAPTATPSPPPDTGEKVRIDLEPAGGGDYPSLAEALAAAPSGAQIYLDAGWYILDEGVTVNQAVSLYGAGDPQTIIVSTAPEHVITFDGAGPFVAEGIAFRHDGTEPANVVVVLGGEVQFTFSSFSGAVFSAEAGYGGNGLFLGRSTTGWIYECEMMRNGAQGILLREQAQATVERNDVHHNVDCGIGYFGQAAGTAQHNTVRNNRHGICVSDHAVPVMAYNTVRHNESSGIAYYGQAAGTAQDNDASLNGFAGISLQGQAAPLLERNVCFGNAEVDIGYYEAAGGQALANRCSTDAPYGLYVADTAGPNLADNQCLLAGAAAQPGGGAVAAPRYNPDGLQGLGPMCFNRPQQAVDGEWQTAAGTRSALIGESVELSLRNGIGEPGESYDVAVVVTDPEGTRTTADVYVTGDEDAILIYPDEFPSATTDLRGAYTVVWELNGGFLACDGFVTTGGASW